MTNIAETAPEAAIFQTTDVLVSRTDKRGVIQAANEVFQRVSCFTWEALHNAPHRMVRHPDMPKGVFWLFWNKLERDRPIGAFVKNRTNGGGHYWVFAIATPLDGGYMSVRLKPEGELFEATIKLYQSRLAAEQAEGCTPEESAESLIEEVKALGFHSYDAFMTKALVQQIGQRDDAMGRPHNAGLVHMSRAIEAWDRVYLEIQATIAAFETFERLPANMRIQAAHLSREGVPLGVIAGNFSALSEQIEALTSQFYNGGLALERQLLDGLFLKSVQQVQNEVVTLCPHGEGRHGWCRQSGRGSDYAGAKRPL